MTSYGELQQIIKESTISTKTQLRNLKPTERLHCTKQKGKMLPYYQVFYGGFTPPPTPSRQKFLKKNTLDEDIAHL